MRRIIFYQFFYGSNCVLTKKQSITLKQIGERWLQTKPSSSKPREAPTWGRAIWNNLFGKYLLATNTISAGVLMAAGDILSQEFDFRRSDLKERYDWSRIGRMFAVGSIQGPLHHVFYRWMDDIMPKTTMKTTTWKILLDQFIMSPMCIVLFFYPASLLENKSIGECNKELIQKFPTVYMADWLIWPGAQFINFHYLQPQYRVVYINVITMLYNVFLSYIKHHNPDEVKLKKLL